MMSKPIQAEFPIGTTVQIKERTELEVFMCNLNSSNPLTPHHLCDAGERGVVDSVNYDHDGHPIYTLERIGGTWPEECIVACRQAHDIAVRKIPGDVK
jgi:hypothetical protein